MRYGQWKSPEVDGNKCESITHHMAVSTVPENCSELSSSQSYDTILPISYLAAYIVSSVMNILTYELLSPSILI